MPAGTLALVTKGKRLQKSGSRRRPRRTKKVALTLRTKPKINRLISSSRKSPFGQSHTSNFRYVQQIALSSGLTASAHSFRINSMYDPDFTGVGHQPLFRDVLSGIYARYRVNYVKYKITFIHNNNANLLLGCFATQDTGYNPNTDQFQNIIEKRNSEWRFQNINCPGVVMNGVLTNNKVAGVSRQAYKDERNYSAAVGSNPILELFLTIFMQDINSSSITQQVMVELEYNTTYYEPVVQAQN